MTIKPGDHVWHHTLAQGSHHRASSATQLLLTSSRCRTLLPTVAPDRSRSVMIMPGDSVWQPTLAPGLLLPSASKLAISCAMPALMSESGPGLICAVMTFRQSNTVCAPTRTCPQPRYWPAVQGLRACLSQARTCLASLGLQRTHRVRPGAYCAPLTIQLCLWLGLAHLLWWLRRQHSRAWPAHQRLRRPG